MNIDQLIEKLDFSHCYTTDKRHCRMLYHEAVSSKAKYIVEVGSFMGISTACLALAAMQNKGCVYAIDPSVEWDADARAKLLADLGLDTRVCQMIGTWEDFYHVVCKKDKDKPDFIFHDGIHGEQAMHEYVECWDVLTEDGVFVAHDLDQVDRKKLEKLLGCSNVAYDTDGKGRMLGIFHKG